VRAWYVPLHPVTGHGKAMRNTAETVALDAPLAAAPRAVLQLAVEDDEERDARERLIRLLAADRLRDLRDDGVTPAYIARMYGIDGGLLEQLSEELLPGRAR
jgi:hypothetical protein